MALNTGPHFLFKNLMIRIFLIHNNEADRLDYVVPEIENLISYLKINEFTDVEFIKIEPELSGMADRVERDSIWNKLRRSYSYAQLMIAELHYKDGFSKSDFEKERKFLRLRPFLNFFSRSIRKHKRSIKIEQEVLYAHAVAWSWPHSIDDVSLIIESDVKYKRNSIESLTSIFKAICNQSIPVYVDIAGGCELNEILGAWQFLPENGCKYISLSDVPALSIRGFANNTVAGYIINASTADLFNTLFKSKQLLPPDWLLMSWAFSGLLGKVKCFHADPSVLLHGSEMGFYQSSISSRSL